MHISLCICFDYIIAKLASLDGAFNPFKSEFTSVIFIHYKPKIAVAILDL